MKNTYQISIGNIGMLYYSNKKEALKVYKECVNNSRTGYGRIAGESVVLIEGDNIIKEYIGTIDMAESD